MKSLLFILLLPALSGGQPDLHLTVPAVVREAFTQMYPAAPAPFWENREGALVANFQWEDRLTKVFFTEKGEWLETRTRLPEAQLPVSVRDYLRAHYPQADYSYIGEVKRETGRWYRIESEMPEAIAVKLLSPAGKLEEEEIFLLDISIFPWTATELLPRLPVFPVSKTEGIR